MGTEVREVRFRIEFVGGKERWTRLLVYDMDGEPPVELYEGPPMRENPEKFGERYSLPRVIWRHILGFEKDAMLAALDPLVDLPAYVDFGPKKGF